MVSGIVFYVVIYILEPCIKYQWTELEKTNPTIPNTQNLKIHGYRNEATQ